MKHSLTEASKRQSSLRLNDKDLPEMKNHKVGSRHHFLVEVEHRSTRKIDPDTLDYNAPMVQGKPTPKVKHTMEGEYRIHSISPVAMRNTVAAPKEKKAKIMKKGAKIARYK